MILSRSSGPVAAIILGTSCLHAAPEMQFDFNGLNLGDLRDQVDNSPNSSGDWDGKSGVPEVVDASLAAPAGLNYAFSAGGVSRHAEVTRVDTAYRGQFHNVSSRSGVVWVSALIKSENRSAAAVVFDGADTADLEGYSLLGKPGFGIRPNASAGNTELFWSDDLTDLSSNQSATLSSDFSDQVVLVLARIDFGGSGNDVELWVNPVLSTAAALGTADLDAATSRASMSWIGLGAVDTGLTGYQVEFDNILVSGKSDEEEAFAAVTGLPFVPGPPEEATADINGNGLPDLAELRYPGLSSLPPTADEDGDGQSNEEEAEAGTDPFDPASHFKVMEFGAATPAATNYDFTFTSVAGRRYGIEVNETLEAAGWTSVPGVIAAAGSTTTVSIPISSFPSSDHSFVRAAILPDVDSDDDGLEDGLEVFLGYSGTNDASVRASSAGGDLQQFTNLMTGGNAMGGMAGTTAEGVPSDEQASRFLAQATWGPTVAKIAALKALGPNAYEQWIDQQLLEPANLTRPYVDLLWNSRAADVAADWDTLPQYIRNNSSFAMYRENLNTVWMRLALFADDELRQRMAWSLSQILVIGPRCNSYGLAASSWYDTLLVHSFGSYRDLLYDMSIHPWMGWWLSHIGNRKADPLVNQLPDENFAREIMQLFSIGLWELNMDGTQKLDLNGAPIPTYSNEDIAQLARVFTGLDAQSGLGGRIKYATPPMQMIESRHDDGDAVMAGVYGAGEKVFLGGSLPIFADDPGRTGLDDVSDAVDILINHPSCPPFISKNLIQHMVTSNPSPAYVERVATVFADDGTGTRGNLAAVAKAILLDPEARDLSHALNPDSGRLKGPMLRTVGMARALDAGAATPALHDLTGIQFWAPSKDTVYSDFLEYPFQSPSVFNFYEPGYSHPGEVRDKGLLSPEFQVMNALTATTIPNRLLDFIEDGLHDDNEKNFGVVPDFSLKFGVLESLSTDTDLLMDRLNLLFSNGTVSAEARVELRSRIDYYSATVGNADERARLALFLSLVSPDGAVLK